MDLQIASFTDTPDPVPRGGTVTYTLTVLNGDADVASNVVLSLPLPANTQFVSAADRAVAGACLHDGGTPGTVTCNYATLRGTLAVPAGPVRTVDIVVRTLGTSVTTLNPVATVSGSGTDVNPANDSLGQNTTVVDGADLASAIVGSPNPVTGGANMTWTVSASNAGPNASGAITWSATLPAVLSYVSANGSGWSCNAAPATTITCTRAAAAPGALPALSVITKVVGSSAGTVTLAGSVASTVGDPQPSNNAATASVGVTAGADLAITQDTPSPSPATASNPVTLVLRPSHAGGSALPAGAVVTLPLPAGWTLSGSSASSGWSCTSSGAPVTVTCSSGALAPLSSAVLTLTVLPADVGAPTPYSLTATVTAASGGPTDPVSANNTASQSLTVNPNAVDLRLQIFKSPNPIALGVAVGNFLTVSNLSALVAPVNSVTLSATLDTARETYTNFTGTGWTCTYTAPTLNCSYAPAIAAGASAQQLRVNTVASGTGLSSISGTVVFSGTPAEVILPNNTTSAVANVTPLSDSIDVSGALTVSTPGGVQNTLEGNETTYTQTFLVTNKPTSLDARLLSVRFAHPGRTSATPVGVSWVLGNTSGNSTASFTCTGQGVQSSSTIVVCNQTSATVLAPGDTVTFTVTADRPLNTVTNQSVTASVNSTVQGDTTTADNSASATITIDPVADLELVGRLWTNGSVRAGTPATTTITLRNNGPQSATGLALTDSMPVPVGDAGYTFLSAVASDGGTCSGLTAGQSYGSGSAPVLSCSFPGSVGSGNTRTVTITTRPNWQAGTSARSFTGTAAATATTLQGANTAPDSASSSLTVTPAEVDLLVNNTDSPDPLGYDGGAPANNDVTYTVALTNSGPSLATDVTYGFTMTPPAGRVATFRGDGSSAGVAAANPTGTIPGSLCTATGTSVTGPASLTVNCQLPAPASLAAGATVPRYLVWRLGSPPATGGDVYSTAATVAGNETDVNSANDSESELTTVRVRADLTITKQPTLATVQLRQPFAWTIVLSNSGPGDSQSTQLTDTLPAGMTLGGAGATWTSTAGGSGVCSATGQTLNCVFGLLPAGASVTVTVPVRIDVWPGTSTVQNCASATTSEVDPVGANNLAVCGTVTL